MAAGEEDREEPLRVKAGERSERIVARDPPAKGRYGRGPNSLTGEQRLKGTPPPRLRHHGSNSAIEPQRLAPSISVQWREARLLAQTGNDADAPKRLVLPEEVLLLKPFDDARRTLPCGQSRNVETQSVVSIPVDQTTFGPHRY